MSHGIGFYYLTDHFMLSCRLMLGRTAKFSEKMFPTSFRKVKGDQTKLPIEPLLIKRQAKLNHEHRHIRTGKGATSTCTVDAVQTVGDWMKDKRYFFLSPSNETGYNAKKVCSVLY